MSVCLHGDTVVLMKNLIILHLLNVKQIFYILINTVLDMFIINNIILMQ